MQFKYLISSFVVFVLVNACQVQRSISKKNEVANTNKSVPLQITDSVRKPIYSQDKLKKENEDVVINDTTFVNLRDFSNDFVYNMKYAKSDNFLHAKVYDCEACYLRYKTVKSLLKANEKFLKKGYRIVIYDCYRPLSIQKKMWAIVSNPKYVADPKKGSIHNRGGAVDISLTDLEGKELDMGTSFDFFGIEASHDCDQLPDEIKDNRKLLRKVMTQNNFKIFESEWWHYNLKNAQKDPVSDFKWKCD
jgi:D-alanyl-D-alanine dipeptidase